MKTAMRRKINHTYALVKKESAKSFCESHVGLLELVVNEYIYGEVVDAEVLSKLKQQDTLVVENVTALGQNVNEIVNTLNIISGYGINIYFAQENLSFKASDLPEIASSLLLVLKLHQSLISLRSKSALQDKKAQGVKLGRTYGSNSAFKLDEHKIEIKRLLSAGVSKEKIAERFNVCRSTVYNFVKKNPELYQFQ